MVHQTIIWYSLRSISNSLDYWTNNSISTSRLRFKEKCFSQSVLGPYLAVGPESLWKRTTLEAVYCLEVSHLSGQSSKWAADPWPLTLKGFISVLREGQGARCRQKWKLLCWKPISWWNLCCQTDRNYSWTESFLLWSLRLIAVAALA